jgi:hypothetical protein
VIEHHKTRNVQRDDDQRRHRSSLRDRNEHSPPNDHRHPKQRFEPQGHSGSSGDSFAAPQPVPDRIAVTAHRGGSRGETDSFTHQHIAQGGCSNRLADIPQHDRCC